MMELFSDEPLLVRMWPAGLRAACELAGWSMADLERAAVARGAEPGAAQAYASGGGDPFGAGFWRGPIKSALLEKVALPLSLKMTAVLLKPKELWGECKMRRPFASEIEAYDCHAAARIRRLEEIEGEIARLSRFDEIERRRNPPNEEGWS